MSWLSLNNQAGYELLIFKFGKTLQKYRYICSGITYFQIEIHVVDGSEEIELKNIRIIHILVLTSKNALDDGSRN